MIVLAGIAITFVIAAKIFWREPESLEIRRANDIHRANQFRANPWDVA